MYALMDCSNFFVSCERVFNPSLSHQPVIVLSSNDGCAISRSEEVKALGIPMGVPLFKIKHLIQQHSIKVFSSNFTLYADMSQRVMEILENLGFNYEPYSIDESFIELPDAWSLEELERWGVSLKSKISQWLGLPVRIGFGSTKTLAKLANERAKASKIGVLHIHKLTCDNLHMLPIEEVWGIGRRSIRTFHTHNIKTIGQLLSCSERWVRQAFNLIMLKTIRELKGEPCFLLNEGPELQKSMVISRSFSGEINTLEDVSERISIFASRAGEKLRQTGFLAREMGVFIRTSPFKEEVYSNSIIIPIPHYTNDTKDLIAHGLTCLQKIYKPGKQYKKAGIYICDMTDRVIQTSLFEPTPSPTPSNLMQAMDKLNQRYGNSTLKFGACGIKVKGGVRNLARRDKLSPNYTSQWSELLTVS